MSDALSCTQLWAYTAIVDLIYLIFRYSEPRGKTGAPTAAHLPRQISSRSLVVTYKWEWLFRLRSHTSAITSSKQVSVLIRYSYYITNHYQCASLININKRLFTCIGDRQGPFGRWSPWHNHRLSPLRCQWS